ncbi:MAG: Abi family protein [Clostridiales bacterium]|nr:Abi family protein [Clostridiales bacterium]
MAGIFLWGKNNMEVKKPTTVDEQLQKLKDRGCIIADETFAKRKLQQINYYRLTAYFLPFRVGNDKYKEGTSFDTVYRIYEFDRKLRILIFGAVEEVELMLRTQLSYYHGLKYGALGYMDAENFNNWHNVERFEEHIQKAIDQNQEQPFVKHHIEKYNSQFPIWVIIELFTMGELSFFFSDMLKADKKKIAKTLFGTTDRNVSSWLLCLTNLRNYCAHYTRLYYTKFGTVPATPNGFSYTLHDRIFDYLLVLKFLYPDFEMWNNIFLTHLKSLIEEYSSVIEMEHIGFPENWEDLLKYSAKLELNTRR